MIKGGSLGRLENTRTGMMGIEGRQEGGGVPHSASQRPSNVFNCVEFVLVCWRGREGRIGYINRWLGCP
jgi:hypothetical protein